MAYQSLYRRYRSQRFDEVLGQDHVTTALKNAVREERVAQGYLFSGPRGTGKTSTARILAKVLNCQAPTDGEPCNACDACMAVTEGRGVDWLQELDAASNNKVDDMRDLLSRVSMGTSGNRKVYILDEVHMLSAGASNALLKTLEEPPSHVVFVLATTEPEKVLPTIRSRTQHFDFHLLGSEVLAGHVRHVIDHAGLALGEDAVDHVVRLGRGSARDTLSALDQVAAAGGVSDDGSPVDDLVDALGQRDAAAALLAVEAAARTGRDPRVLANALIESLRQAFLVAMGAPAAGLTDRMAERAKAVSEAIGPATLTKALESIGTAIIEMRHAPDPRIPLEVALVQLARPETSGDTSSLITRIERLEAALAGSSSVLGAGSSVPGAGSSSATTTPTSRDTVGPAPAATDGAGSAAAPKTDPASMPAAGRGAEAARARLAQRDTGSSSAPASPAPAPAAGSRPALGGVKKARAAADSSPNEPSAPPSSDRDAGSAESETAPAPAADASPTPAPAPAPAAPAPVEPEAAALASGAGLPSPEELTAAWVGTILESLRGRAKALFKPGTFVEHDGRIARFALPNEPHRKNCLDKIDEVRAAIETHFGRPVPLELVVTSDAAAPAPAASGTQNATTAQVDEQLDEEVDLDELVDAPDATTGGLAQLQDAFPGAELVEDS